MKESVSAFMGQGGGDPSLRDTGALLVKLAGVVDALDSLRSEKGIAQYAHREILGLGVDLEALLDETLNPHWLWIGREKALLVQGIGADTLDFLFGEVGLLAKRSGC